MTQDQYVIRRKLNILELGETLGNISEACRRLNISRQHHYDIKSAVAEEGIEGLLEKSRKVPRVGNRVAPEIEKKVLAYSLEFPTQGQVRVSNELKRQGFQVSCGGVRSIWLRHKLQISSLRLKRLEKWSAENEGILTESQVQALESAKEEKEAMVRLRPRIQVFFSVRIPIMWVTSRALEKSISRLQSIPIPTLVLPRCIQIKRL